MALAVAPVARSATVAGIGHVTPHQLRHTYATALVNAGVSVQALMALLGHVSAEMSLRYAHLFDTTVRAEYERAGSIAQLAAEYDTIAREAHRQRWAALTGPGSGAGKGVIAAGVLNVMRSAGVAPAAPFPPFRWAPWRSGWPAATAGSARWSRNASAIASKIRRRLGSSSGSSRKSRPP